MGCSPVFGHCMLPAMGQYYYPPDFADANRIHKIRALTPQLDSMFSRYARANHFPSVSWGIFTGGRLIHSFYSGCTNLENTTPASGLSDYHIASMTKSFTAMAILKLRDEGKLQLDDPIEKYLPAAKGMKTLTSDAPLITIRHLLTHNEDFPEDNPWSDRQLGRSDAWLDSLYRAGISFSTAPGTAYEYSNLGFSTLGRIINNVTGQTYQQYVIENILQPLGMLHTYFEFGDVPENRLVIGCRYVDGKWDAQPLLHNSSFGAMGRLIAMVEDFGGVIGLFSVFVFI